MASTSLHQLHYDDQEMEDCYFVLRIQVAGLRDMELGQPSSTVLKTGNEATFKVDGSIITLILYIKISFSVTCINLSSSRMAKLLEPRS